MGKFKEFIAEAHQLGLGNLGSQMGKALDHIGEKIGGSFLTSDVSGSEQPEHRLNGLSLPSTDLTIPKIVRTGRIETLLLTKNPIYMRLSDGTEAHLTWDEYKRIQGEPTLGKTMTLTFQRHPNDNSKLPSKIEKAIVLD